MNKKSTGYKLFELAQSNYLKNITGYCKHVAKSKQKIEHADRWRELKMMHYLMEIGCLREYHHNYLEISQRDLDELYGVYDG